VGQDLEQLREIHRGRRFVVRRARRTADGSAVVVKGVRPDCADAIEAAARLEREYTLLGALAVPGAARPVALERVEGQPLLVLEDAGPTLQDRLQGGPVPLPTFLAMAQELAQVLARLHARQIIHREIDPSNVVIDGNDHTTLVDFDGASSLAGAGGGVLPHLEVVTAFTAPEATGRTGRLVDARSDLYSLGAVFYQLLTGIPPFSGRDPIELVHAHLARAPVSPGDLNPSVPVVLSAMVLKLLAKMPEDRYQSASALAVDLAEARARLDATGTIAPFELARSERTPELVPTGRLYQRESERARLRGAWERAVLGERNLALLSGPAGVGKSILAAELGRRIEEGGGGLLAGKFDRSGRPAPYAAVAEATADRVGDLLAAPDAEREAARQRLREALGSNAGLMIELCPELHRLLGDQEPVPPLGPVESETRFLLTFQAFLRSLAGADRPMAILLDDVQWADLATLRLLRFLAIDADLPRLLLVLAARTEELAADHPVAALLARVAEAGTPVERIDVAPLEEAALTDLCGDLLQCDASRARSLAQLLRRKSGGNPLFVWQLLHYLHGQGLLSRDPGRSSWSWDPARIESVQVTDNVADLLVAALGGLSPEVQLVARAASCLGRVVAPELISAVTELSPEAAGRALVTAVEQGLLVRMAGGFAFVHDRVAQAADALLTEPERQRFHRRAGRHLLAGCTERELDDRVFVIADHMHRAGPIGDEPGERIGLVELNLRAARKARRSSAPGPAMVYLERGIALLPEDAWRTHHPLAFALYSQAIEGATFTGQAATADRLFAETLARADSVLEKASLYDVCLRAAIVHGKREEALRLGREGLHLLGIGLPASESDPAIAHELTALAERLRARPIEELRRAPAMEDPVALLCMQLIGHLVSGTYATFPNLSAFLVARRINLSLVHGPAPAFARAYVDYGNLVARISGDYPQAHAFGSLALEMSRRLGEPGQLCWTITTFSATVAFWAETFDTILRLLREGQSLALELGDLLLAVANITTRVMVLFHQGRNLGRILGEIDAGVRLAAQINVKLDLERLLGYRRAVRRLQGVTAAETEGGAPAGPREQIRLPVAYLLGDLDEARALSATFSERLPVLTRSLEAVEHTFYTALTLAAGSPDASRPESREALDQIRRLGKQLESWAALAPGSYRAKHLLLSAELARLEERWLEADVHYEQAIEAAARDELLLDEALAHELHGRFCRRLERRRAATWLLTSAVALYSRWGARAKVQALQEEFPELTAVDPPASPAWLNGPSDPSGSGLDRMSAYRAAETISGEVKLDRLLDTLMQVCLTTAGAVRGALLIEEQQELFVRAVKTAGEPATLQRTPLSAATREVPATVIEQVRRSQEPLVLGDALGHPSFGADPYIADNAVRSLLAMPILRQGRLVGVLCLENHLATRAFTAERIQVLQLLSSQIAISLENGLLFERLTSEVQERTRAQTRLQFLAESGAVLAQSLDFGTTLRKIGRLAVSFLADWCTIDLVEDARIRRVVAVHRDPHKEKLLDEVRQLREREGSPAGTTVRVIETGEPLVYGRISDQLIEELTPEPAIRKLLREVGVASGMVLPLVVGDLRFGAISFASGDPDREYGDEDLALGQELARRAALALDNARLYQEAREALRLRNEFLSVASHELNTPNAALRLTVESALQALASGAGDRELPRLLLMIERQSGRLARLTRELLDVSRLERGPVALQLASVDLMGVVKEAVQSFAAELDRRGCPVSVSGRAVTGRWDPARLQEVLSHLLSNASKFGPDQPIEIHVDQVGERALLSVQDHGIGLDPANQGRIFDLFARAVSAEHYGGLGLGLYICRRLIEAHGGTISASNVPGAGARFELSLPCAGPAVDVRTGGG
jgi:predicted ATPase/signal transduction histidine kinase